MHKKGEGAIYGESHDETCDVTCTKFYRRRRDELFPDASSFKPERFLHPEADTKDSNLYHFIPFLYGPRQCLGYRFAEVEMRALLAVLLRQFQFDVDAEGPAVYRRSLTIIMRPDPPLRLRISALKERHIPVQLV